jgi:hypothetical protein
MTCTQKLKRLYMILRWYDSYVGHRDKTEEMPEEDMKLALELEKEMHELQRIANAAKKPRKPKAVKRKNKR